MLSSKNIRGCCDPACGVFFISTAREVFFFKFYLGGGFSTLILSFSSTPFKSSPPVSVQFLTISHISNPHYRRDYCIPVHLCALVWNHHCAQMPVPDHWDSIPEHFLMD